MKLQIKDKSYQIPELDITQTKQHFLKQNFSSRTTSINNILGGCGNLPVDYLLHPPSLM